jgi:large subunit ribosomal protein L16
MLLAPSRTKYRRQHRGRMKGAAQRGNTLAFGEFGLQALEPCWLEARQIESARIALTRFMKRGGKVWIRVFPDKPITAKPAETRMGSGKGAVDHWVVVVKPGRIIFEIGGVSEEVAKEAVRLASHKLPVSTRFITRGEAESVEA